jgi:1-acyl-sn-glycerol-3-phosphate acyltransferase
VTDAADRKEYVFFDPGAEMGLPARLLYRTLWVLVGAVAKAYFRYEVHGREHLPAEGPFVLSPVHRSYMDTPLIGLASRRRLRYMGKESLWTSRFGGFFLSTMGGFPVHRGTADREALRACLEVLRRGEPLVMFPEGTRRDGPVVKAEEMHDGPAFVAGRAGAPIVPVGIGGSDRIMPRHARFVYPRKVVMIIGSPIPPPAQVNGRVPRRAVRETTDLLRERIQALYDEAQRRATRRRGRPGRRWPSRHDR